MVAVASLIVVLFLSLIIVRVAAEALILTGLSRQAARFQARSAWTGTGFTTSESEAVVSHPVRREIISLLMFLRNAGLVTAASTLMLSFVNVDDRGEGFLRFLWLLGGLALFWLFARSRWIDVWMSRVVSRLLKRMTALDTRDYASLLHLAGAYGIMELPVRDGGWLAGKALDELLLDREGVLVLGIVHRDKTYIGAPRGDTRILPGDTLVLYGRSPVLGQLGRRRADASGAAEHQAAVTEQRRVEDEAAGE